jgi:hypothetical protein
MPGDGDADAFPSRRTSGGARSRWPAIAIFVAGVAARLARRS